MCIPVLIMNSVISIFSLVTERKIYLGEGDKVPLKEYYHWYCQSYYCWVFLPNNNFNCFWSFTTRSLSWHFSFSSLVTLVFKDVISATVSAVRSASAKSNSIFVTKEFPLLVVSLALCAQMTSCSFQGPLAASEDLQQPPRTSSSLQGPPAAYNTEIAVL